MGTSGASESGPQAPKEVPAEAGVDQRFLAACRRYLLEEYPAKIDVAISGLPPEDLWWRPHADQNSIANLLVHLAGNVRQWVVHGVGRRPDRRDRAGEFAARAEDIPDPRRTLRSALDEAGEVLESLAPAALGDPRDIQGYRTTVQDALFHVVEHFSMHTGQILYIARLRSGRDLALYEVDDQGRVTGENW